MQKREANSTTSTPERVEKKTDQATKQAEQSEIRPITSPEQLAELGVLAEQNIREQAAQDLTAEADRLQQTITDLELSGAELTAGHERLAPGQAERDALVERSAATLDTTLGTAISPRETPARFTRSYTLEQLRNLREKTAADYKDELGGLINNKHKHYFEALSGRDDLSPKEQHLFKLAKSIRVSKLREKRVKLAKKGNELSAEDAAWLTAHEAEYGEPLSNDDAMEITEAAQEHAYSLLDRKIESGVVDPAAIKVEMLKHLHLDGKIETKVAELKDIPGLVESELESLVTSDKVALERSEAVLIMKEAKDYLAAYQEAFKDQELDPQKVYALVIDNARKLVYQTSADKRVFSGSDHGTRHILEGNMHYADQMLEQLGDRASALDKVLIRQIIIDHDLGYTTGVAQAKESWEASKDHPLFSAKYIEAHRDEYIERFGPAGYETIRDAILQHSYPMSEYNSPKDPDTGLNPDLIRSITSTVDALGVTAEIKCPAFFRKPEVIETLQKVKMYMDTHLEPPPAKEGASLKEQDDAKKAKKEYKARTKVAMDKFKAEMHVIADQEPIEDRKKAFHKAIDTQFNPRTAEMTLGQYTGMLREIQMDATGDRIVPKIRMEISRSQALIGDMFGDPVALKAFTKAMEDFGVSKKDMQEIGKQIRRLQELQRKAKIKTGDYHPVDNTKLTPGEHKELMELLNPESDRFVFRSASATFEFSPTFSTLDAEVLHSFERVRELSIQAEVRTFVHTIEAELKEGRIPNEEVVDKLIFTLESEISAKAELSERVKLTGLGDVLAESLKTQDIVQIEAALRPIKQFTTKRERDFMGVE